MVSDREWVAFVDESESNPILDPDTYILAAAIAEPDIAGDATEAIRGIRLPQQKKLRWSDESSQRRAKVAATVASLPLEHLVIVRACAPEERPERRRRRCLEQLCWNLERLDVAEMVMESRGPKDDRRDLAALQAFRSQRIISGRLRMTHRAGPAEPLLWIADAVCGAIVADRTGIPSYLDTIRAACTIIEVD